MNIFWLDKDLTKCAQYHNNKHCIKMILEYAQLLSAAHHLNNSSIKNEVYKLSHTGHPCIVWVSSSMYAYDLLLKLFVELCKEYTYRYGKVHKSYIKCYHHFAGHNPCPDVSAPPFPLCMPDEYKVDCHIQSYRNYYIYGKRHLRLWGKRGRPSWWVDV